jgi:hypothetical protein
VLQRQFFAAATQQSILGVQRQIAKRVTGAKAFSRMCPGLLKLVSWQSSEPWLAPAFIGDFGKFHEFFSPRHHCFQKRFAVSCCSYQARA